MEHNDRRGEAEGIIRDYRRDFKNRESGSSSEITGAYSQKTHSRKTTYDLLVGEGTKLHLLEKMTGVSLTEFQNWNCLRRMFSRKERECLYIIKKINNMNIALFEFPFMKLKKDL